MNENLNKIIHSSHEMTEWRSTIVTIISTSRFGEIRTCGKCGGEQARTVAGSGTHDILKIKCKG